MRTIKITSEQDTKEFGLDLAKQLEPGSIIGLTGDLGTGKTTLTRYIAQGLEIPGPIQSPTFTIIREHAGGRLPLFHFDVYRLDEPDDLYEIGYQDYFYGQGVTVVEWADKIRELMPPWTIWIEIAYDGGLEEGRVYQCTC